MTQINGLSNSLRFTDLVSWIDSRVISILTGIAIPPGIPEVLEEIHPRPILFIDTGEGRGRDLVRHYYGLADEPKELWEIPETFHGGQFMARPAEYEERMIRFFNDALLEQ